MTEEKNKKPWSEDAEGHVCGFFIKGPSPDGEEICGKEATHRCQGVRAIAVCGEYLCSDHKFCNYCKA